MLLERLLENLALELEAFATCRVAPGWRLRLPALDWVTFHFVVRGEGSARDGIPETFPLTPGSFLAVPRGMAHSLQCGPGPHAEEGAGSSPGPAGLPVHLAGPRDADEMVVVCGRARVLYGGGLEVFDQLREMLVVEFREEPRVLELYEAMMREVRADRPGARAMIAALMDELLIHLFRRLTGTPDASLPWLDALEDPELRPAMAAMLTAPESPHTVASLADLCYLSRSAFARRFRAAFGTPPMEYLRGIRLRHAARLLRQDPAVSVARVARRVGFSSRSQFSRAFKASFHASPSEFREPEHEAPAV